MLPTPVKLLLNFFDMLGIFTECPPQNYLQKFRYVCAIVVFLLFSNIINYYKWSSSMSLADQINSVMQVYGGLFSYSMILLHSAIYRREHRLFWTLFQEFHTQFGQQPTYYNWNQTIIKFIVLFFIFSINVYIAVLEYPNDYIIELLAIFVVVRIYHIRIIQYLIYMDIIVGNVKMLHLKTIEATVSRGPSKEFLKDIRDIHKKTFDMVDCLNEAFGVSQFVVLLVFFFLHLTDLNWDYLHLSEETMILKTSNVLILDFTTHGYFIAY